MSIKSLLEYARMPQDELIERILSMKEELDAVIFAHNYQRIEVQRIADFRGDSLELARKAKELDAKIILFCGVMFMAETAKILNPEKTVLIPDVQSGCPLAAHASADDVIAMKKKFPNYAVVSYINSSAEVKAVSDIICTSANSVKVVNSIPEERGIIFLPDKNLCHYTKTQTHRENIVCWDGNCYVHDRFTVEDLKNARGKHPKAKIIVHPEAPPDVQKDADFIASTGGMYRFAKEHRGEEIVLGTEVGMVERINDEFPDTPTFPMSESAICSNMKLITLAKVARSLDEKIFEVVVPDEIAERAKIAIEKMLAL